MNVSKDIFEAWQEQIRAQSKMWWSLITDDDFNKVEKALIKFDKYVMILKVNTATPGNAPGRKATDELQS